MSNFSKKDLEQIESPIEEYITVAENLGTTLHAVASWYDGGNLWSAIDEEINAVDKLIKEKLGEELYHKLDVNARLGKYIFDIYGKRKFPQLNAKWAMAGKRAKSHKVLAVSIGEATEIDYMESGATYHAWVEYEDTLVEAFIFFEGIDGWFLDDMGLGCFTTKSPEEKYPYAEDLINSHWELKPYQIEDKPNEWFWKPIRKM